MSGPSVKIPAEWLDSDHIEDLGGDVVLLMLTALAYSARHNNDGTVPRRALRKLWPIDNVDRAVELLTQAGELETTPDGFLFTNWRDFILDQDEVERIREQSRTRSARQRRHQRGDHSMCLPRYCRAARDIPRDNSRDGDGTVRVSDDDPYLTAPPRPLGRGGRGGRPGADSAGATSTTSQEEMRRVPHEWTYADDEDGPCTTCGLNEEDLLVHEACTWTPDNSRPDICALCNHPVNYIGHWVQRDYDEHLERGEPWDPQDMVDRFAA